MSREEQLAELDNKLQSLRNCFAGENVRDVFSPLEQSYKTISETGTIQKQRLDNEIQSKLQRNCKNEFLYRSHHQIGGTSKRKIVWWSGSHRQDCSGAQTSRTRSRVLHRKLKVPFKILDPSLNP